MAHEVDLFDLDLNLTVQGDRVASRTITLGQQTLNPDVVDIDVPFANVNVNGQRLAFQNNLGAIIPPTATDDGVAGYEVGSMWIDTVADQFFVCVDATTAAAVWTPDITGITVYSDNVIDPTPAAGTAVVYAKDDGTGVRMFIRDEDGLISGLTSTHGSMAIEENVTETAITTASTDFTNKVQVFSFNTNGPINHGTTPDHTSDHVTIDIPGVFKITMDLTFVGVANSTISGALFKNNGATRISPKFVHDIRTNATAGVASISAVVELVPGDTVELWIQNEANTANFTITNGNMALAGLA